MSIVPIARELARRYIVPAGYVDFARRYTNRIFSDYVGDSGGGPTIQSNTRPQMPFQLGSLKRKRSDDHGNSKVHIGSDSSDRKFSVKNNRNSAKSGAMYAGKIGKGSKKFKYTKHVQIQKKNGVNHTVETNGTATGNDTVWIGHSAFPQANIYYQAVKVAYKMLLKRAGIEVVSSDQDIASIPNGSSIEIQFKTSPDGTFSSSSWTYAATIARTMDHFVDWFTNTARSWAFVPEAAFGRMSLVGVNQQVYIDLNTLLIEFHCKSTLKVQNRSYNQTEVEQDDNIEESDAVPLVGKSYGFNGTELKFKKAWIANSTSPNVATADQYTGHVTASEFDQSMKEPPNGYVEFTNCKRVGKIYLNPGELKKSVVSFGKKMYFQTLHTLVGDVPTQSSASTRRKSSRNIGQSVVYCLEKMINTSEVHGIRVAFEINCETSCTGKLKRTYSTVKSFEKVSI